MNVRNARQRWPDADKKVKSARWVVWIFVGCTVLVAIIEITSIASGQTKIADPTQFTQAVLVASTALMGFSGIVLLDVRKTPLRDPKEIEGLEHASMVNLIESTLLVDYFLKWSLWLSLAAILLSVFRFVFNSIPLTVLAAAAFILQVMFFALGLLYSELFPGL